MDRPSGWILPLVFWATASVAAPPASEAYRFKELRAQELLAGKHLDQALAAVPELKSLAAGGSPFQRVSCLEFEADLAMECSQPVTAAATYQRAIDLARKEAPDYSAYILRLLKEEADALRAAGRKDQLPAVGQEWLEVVGQASGPESLEAVQAELQYANLWNEAGNQAEAQAHLAKAQALDAKQYAGLLAKRAEALAAHARAGTVLVPAGRGFLAVDRQGFPVAVAPGPPAQAPLAKGSTIYPPGPGSSGWAIGIGVGKERPYEKIEDLGGDLFRVWLPTSRGARAGLRAADGHAVWLEGRLYTPLRDISFDFPADPDPAGAPGLAWRVEQLADPEVDLLLAGAGPADPGPWTRMVVRNRKFHRAREPKEVVAMLETDLASRFSALKPEPIGTETARGTRCLTLRFTGTSAAPSPGRAVTGKWTCQLLGTGCYEVLTWTTEAGPAWLETPHAAAFASIRGE